jgi:hypothetical protein
MLRFRYFCLILTKLGSSRQIFMKIPNTKFQGNPPSGSQADMCGQTDGPAGTELKKITGVCRNRAKATDSTAVHNKYVQLTALEPIAGAARSTAWVCGCSLAGIAVSNSAGGMDICLL